jgi:hypothetical protein
MNWVKIVSTGCGFLLLAFVLISLRTSILAAYASTNKEKGVKGALCAILEKHGVVYLIVIYVCMRIATTTFSNLWRWIS